MQFMNAFNENIALRHKKIVNDRSVGQAIEIFVTKQGISKWENGELKGTMTELLPLLREIAKNDLQLESVKIANSGHNYPIILVAKLMKLIQPSDIRNLC
jgi:hypothetical protein